MDSDTQQQRIVVPLEDPLRSKGVDGAFIGRFLKELKNALSGKPHKMPS